MPVKLHVFRASWTLVDQGLVSLGAFLVNVQLARQLVSDDYGTFALLFGGLLALQLFNSSLLLYPMSIRLPVTHGAGRGELHSATALLVVASSIPLSAVLAAALHFFGRDALILPALAAFFCWQMQETMRRALLAEFRHRTAIIGDLASYSGQVAGVAALVHLDQLSLKSALEVMAAAYALGAIIQALQLRLSLRRFADLRQTLTDFWSIGSWSLANNVISLLRIQILPWALAAAGGPAAAASFQAVINVVNLTNPIILGLCNIIPQTAARAQQSGGNAEAWRAARIYMLIGAPPTFGYYAIAFMAPSLLLGIFYGSGSPYVSLTLAVQILVSAWGIGYLAEMTCSYLHGVNGARLALVINSLGALSTVLLAPPLTQAYGLAGACLSLVGANLVRLAASYHIQKRITVNECIAA